MLPNPLAILASVPFQEVGLSAALGGMSVCRLKQSYIRAGP